jgi:hypothetical protein
MTLSHDVGDSGGYGSLTMTSAHPTDNRPNAPPSRAVKAASEDDAQPRAESGRLLLSGRHTTCWTSAATRLGRDHCTVRCRVAEARTSPRMMRTENVWQEVHRTA